MGKKELIKGLREKIQFYNNKLRQIDMRSWSVYREQRAYYKGVLYGIHLAMSLIGSLDEK